MGRLTFILIFIGLCTTTYSQRGFEVGGFAGASWYFGDINNEFRLNSPGATIGAASRFNFDEKGFVSSWVLITFGLEAMTIKVQTYFSRQEILVLTTTWQRLPVN